MMLHPCHATFIQVNASFQEISLHELEFILRRRVIDFLNRVLKLRVNGMTSRR